MSTAQPAVRVLSLGAGVQSTTLLLLAAEGRLPSLDAAIFADTGWEPAAVYDHLERLDREVARPAGIPVLRVRAGTGTGRVTGNLRADSLDPGAFVRLPVFVADRSGAGTAMVRRQCTEEYLRASGWATTPKSACIGCPFHGNRQWRSLRDTCACGHHRDEHHPADGTGTPVCDHRETGDRCPCGGFHAPEWDDAVAFDHALRRQRLRGIKQAPYLHRSRQPLDLAPIDKVTRREWTDRQTDLFDSLADDHATDDGADDENGTPDGCSPWACRGDQTNGGEGA